MDITKSVTKTSNEVVGYKCDMCQKEYPDAGAYPLNKGTLRQALDDFHDSTFTKSVDLCMYCTEKVFGFIESKGGKINSDF